MAEHETPETNQPDSTEVESSVDEIELPADETDSDLAPPVDSTEASVAGAVEDGESVSTAEHESDQQESDQDEADAPDESAFLDSEQQPAEQEQDEPEEDNLHRGDLIEGQILRMSPTEIVVDLGDLGEGVINSRELERLTSSTLESLQEDTSVLVYVLSSANEDGKPVLSISRALEESDWRTAENYLETKEVYTGKVAGYNKGGLIVRFGRLRGFVPASQISQERRERAKGDSPEERWGGMLGETIYVKVVELKRSRNRLILSEQAAVREMREIQKSQLLDDLRVGERRTGRVTSITDFGAFVDLGGADGLVHLTELSWKHVTHASEVVSVGQEVEVEVISVDVENKRIGLSIRRTENDPWRNIEQQYVKGQLIQASITKLTKFGAFARLVDHPEIEGLIHVSELSEHRVRHPREVVSKGDVLTLRIIKIDRDQRRLGLSLKQVDSSEYMDIDWNLMDES